MRRAPPQGAVPTHRVPNWLPRSVRGIQAEPSRAGVGARKAMTKRRGGGQSPSQGQNRGRSVPGAPRTAKLSPPPRSSGRRRDREGEPKIRCLPAPGAAGEGAREGRGGLERTAPAPRSPHLCPPGRGARPALTWL